MACDESKIFVRGNFGNLPFGGGFLTIVDYFLRLCYYR